jgi:hypothetical protein
MYSSLIMLLLYYFNNIGLQVSPTYKSQRRQFSLINRYMSCSMIYNFFVLQFCITRKLSQCDNIFSPL